MIIIVLNSLSYKTVMYKVGAKGCVGQKIEMKHTHSRQLLIKSAKLITTSDPYF